MSVVIPRVKEMTFSKLRCIVVFTHFWFDFKEILQEQFCSVFVIIGIVLFNQISQNVDVMALDIADSSDEDEEDEENKEEAEEEEEEEEEEFDEVFIALIVILVSE